ncbi:MAG TPA: AMP-binding protein, partial [Actinomycetales bacterium]|nr:AMP-binding protein [Actinomycetales bacterium]
MTINLADCYEALADALAEREAIVVDGTRLTYADLDAEANKLGHFLQSIGVQPQDHLAMHMRNSAEFIITL